MNPASAIFRRATPGDAAIALGWSPTAEILRHWAGANVRWPATSESFWEDINNADATPFALVAPDSAMLAFGQIRHREQKYGHLARIIVSPAHRGGGLGRIFCTALMREALKLHPITAFSLYVYVDNTTAISLYESLGYVRGSFHPEYADVQLMIAPLSAVGP